MNGENQNFEFLDILVILSFAMQMQNQSKLVDMPGVQNELQKAVNDIHRHLEKQDEKINKVMEALEIER